jgi:hypothetical protein
MAGQKQAITEGMAYVQFDVRDAMDVLLEVGTIIIGKPRPGKPLTKIAAEYATMQHPGNSIANVETGAVILSRVLSGLVPTQGKLPLEKK